MWYCCPCPGGLQVGVQLLACSYSHAATRMQAALGSPSRYAPAGPGFMPMPGPMFGAPGMGKGEPPGFGNGEPPGFGKGGALGMEKGGPPGLVPPVVPSAGIRLRELLRTAPSRVWGECSGCWRTVAFR